MYTILERNTWNSITSGVNTTSKQGQLSTSCCRDSGGEALCHFKSADSDVILTAAEPGEVFGSDTLRSYYFPPTFLPFWLSWGLKIALGQYRQPAVTMLMIKNSWPLMLNMTEDNEAIQVWDTRVRNHCQPMKWHNLPHCHCQKSQTNI